LKTFQLFREYKSKKLSEYLFRLKFNVRELKKLFKSDLPEILKNKKVRIFMKAVMGPKSHIR